MAAYGNIRIIKIQMPRYQHHHIIFLIKRQTYPTCHCKYGGYINFDEEILRVHLVSPTKLGPECYTCLKYHYANDIKVC